MIRDRFAVLILACSAAYAQSSAVFPTMGQVVRIDPRIDQLIPKDTKIEVLASGFAWSEGPLWIKEGGYLIFSDIPRNSVMKWKEGEGLSVFMKPSGYTGVVDYGREPGSNGLTLDPEGRIVFCEHGDRRISRLEKNGGKRTLVDNYQGKRLNSPNDAVFNSNGDLYFTDPPYGLPQNAADPRRELDAFGVYRRTKDGTVTLLTREFERPNGIAFSPDEKTLYVAQSEVRPIWMAYPVNADGLLGPGRVFAEIPSSMAKLPGAPDGLKVDAKGNVFATGPGGVYVFTPRGELLGRIDTGQRTANCAWGDDGSTLYMTADSYLCRIRTSTRGNRW